MSTTPEPILQVAAKAVLVNPEGKVLILRESEAYDEATNVGRYQGPGGRINPREDYETGLRREVEEETGITDFEVLDPLYVGDWRPVIKGAEHHIIGIFTLCRTKTSEVRLSVEHDDYQWIDPADHSKYDIMDPEGQVIAAYAERVAAGK